MNIDKAIEIAKSIRKDTSERGSFADNNCALNRIRNKTDSLISLLQAKPEQSEFTKSLRDILNKSMTKIREGRLRKKATEACDIIDRLSQQVKELQKCFDLLGSIVIQHSPEIWEYYLEDSKKQQEQEDADK